MNLKTKIFTAIFLSLLYVPLMAGQLSGDAYKKLDPKIALMLERPELRVALTKHLTEGAASSSIEFIPMLIKTSLTTTELRALGVSAQAQIGDIVTACVPLATIETIVRHDGIFYLQLPQKLTIHTDESLSEIKATQAWQQYNVSGQGVIIGVVDTGIDWRHMDFRNSNGTTRIKAMLDFSYPGDTNGDGSLDGPDQYGGTLYTEQEINNALNGIGTINESDVVGHGTHVAGCAAGNGQATGNGVAAGTYLGVAPKADLIIVKATRVQGSISFSEIDYINAIVFIDSLAGQLGKPYVINLSLGGSSGPHDGKGLGEQAIDNLVGPGINGKAVVVSAGNDGEKAIHISGAFGSGTTSIESIFTVPAYTPLADNVNDIIQFDGWYEALFNYSVQIITPSGESYGPVSSGHDSGFDTPEGVIYISNAKGGPSPLNGDKYVLVQIYDYYANKPPKNGNWKIKVFGATGRFDIWLGGSTMDVYFSSNIDYTMIAGTPGTAFNAITVGSYVTKSNWTDLDGNSLYIPGLTVNEVSDFSSPGPTRDGRVKPEICAPGEKIASSYSISAPPSGTYSIFNSGSVDYPNAYICPDNKHALTQGTSMAAPHVAGVVALMFEKYPNRDAIQARNSLIETCRNDSYTGTMPNDQWGYGKIDVAAALLDLPVDQRDDEPTLPTSTVLYQNYPNPFNPTTVISYYLKSPSFVTVRVINVLGQTIQTLMEKEQASGSYHIKWNGKDNAGQPVSSGIYFYRLEAGSFTQTKKMILLP
ncbi:MAG: S8 family serine peptidase [Candidatus Zhuqueibacterota bacterium]